MKRSAAVLAILLCCALAAGCGGEAAEPEETVTVYAISGTSEQMTLSNGILVLTDTEQTLDGGDLTYRPAEPADAAGYATEIYLLSGGERKPLISMKAQDTAGGTLSVSGDVGMVSGEILTEKDLGELERNLYFELQVTNSEGETATQTLPLSLTKVTGSPGERAGSESGVSG